MRVGAAGLRGLTRGGFRRCRAAPAPSGTAGGSCGDATARGAGRSCGDPALPAAGAARLVTGGTAVDDETADHALATTERALLGQHCVGVARQLEYAPEREGAARHHVQVLGPV